VSYVPPDLSPGINPYATDGGGDLHDSDKAIAPRCWNTSLSKTGAHRSESGLDFAAKEPKMKRTTFYLFATSISLATVLVPVIAQQGFTARVIQTVDFPPGYQTVTGIGEFSPGSCAGRHTHPGIENSYILEGEGVIKVDGKPDQRVKAGEPFQVPASVIHDACTTTGMKILAVQIVEKGKPRATPAP
jgi:quercetin dioxygenase-like cupin family protein